MQLCVYGRDGVCLCLRSTGANSTTTEKMLREWSQQSRRGTVAQLGNRGWCVHFHTGHLLGGGFAFVICKSVPSILR